MGALHPILGVQCGALFGLGQLSDSPYQSAFDAAYVYVVPWSEFPTVRRERRRLGSTSKVLAALRYRGTSLIRKRPPP